MAAATKPNSLEATAWLDEADVGNMQQRTGSQSGGFPKDLGRGGGFQQQRGPKSGNVTPKGRGQPQAA